MRCNLGSHGRVGGWVWGGRGALTEGGLPRLELEQRREAATQALAPAPNLGRANSGGFRGAWEHGPALKKHLDVERVSVAAQKLDAEGFPHRLHPVAVGADLQRSMGLN